MNRDILPSVRHTILTGDRPTGPLHLGHYVGSLKTRVALQHEHAQYVMIADAQALTDHMGDRDTVRRNVLEVALDYLAVGIDPDRTCIFVQSQVPELAELAFYYLNLVTVARLERNPTVRQEIRLRGFERDIPAGFLAYPVSQAADITAFRATLVPVGEDQLPMIEQANEIVQRFNRLVGCAILVEARALVSDTGRLPGLDGRKMSKSLRNAIALGASPDEIRRAVREMYTDPLHLRIDDPGRLEGNVAFAFLDAFETDTARLADMKAHYVRGGLGDTTVKKRVEELLQETLRPIRERRQALADDLDHLRARLKQGTARAREVAAATLDDVKAALGIGRHD